MSRSPLEYRRQHGRVDDPTVNEREFRPAWRAVPRLDQLLLGRHITPATWRAADQFRRTWELAHAADLRCVDHYGEPLQDPHTRQRGAGLSEHRLDALRRLARIEQQIGRANYGLVTVLAVEDWSFVQIAARLGRDRRTARKYVLQALELLLATGSASRR